MTNTKLLQPSIYSVSYKDLVDIWIESMHPDDNVIVIWDAKNHLDLIRNSGFELETSRLYDNKILTIILEDIMDCFFVMDVFSSYEDRPYVQLYTKGKFLTDDLEGIREPLD